MLELLVDNRGKNPPFVSSGIPIVTAMSVRHGVLDVTESRHVSEQTWAEWMPTPLRKNDVLLTSEAPLGRVALVRTNDPIMPTQRVFALRGKLGVLDCRFLFYALQTELLQSQLRGRATGTTVVGIRQPALRSVKLTLPSIDGQLAIAEVLGVLDDKIAANRALAKNCEDLLGAHVELLGLDDIKAGAVGALIDLIELNPRLPPPIEEEPVYLEMQALSTNGMSISSWTHRPQRGGARFQNGDTLLARITPCLENRKTGFVDFLDAHQIGLGSTEYIVMRSRPRMPRVLSYFIAVSDRFRTFAIRHMVGTSGRQRVNVADLADYPLCVPDRRVLEAFGTVSEPIASMVSSLRSENNLLETTRDTLLPQLMSGKLRVKDAENQVEAVV